MLGVVVWLHWLLLKGLEHLMKLTKPEMGSENRVIREECNERYFRYNNGGESQGRRTC